MADGENVRSTQEKDLRYNVEVAKRMTVPDEIRLTGPSRSSGDRIKASSSQSSYHLNRQLAPSAPDLEANQDRVQTDKNDNDVALSVPEGVAEAQDELFVRMEAVEEEVRRLKERLDDFESGLPYLNTRRSVLNTLMFMAWLLLPVGVLYLLSRRKEVGRP